MIANIYEGDKLKRLLDQRWTGHYETVKVTIGSHAELVDVLDEATRSPTLPGDVNALAAGLATKIQEPMFVFIAHLLHAVLGLLQPPNRLLQAELTDLALGVELVEGTILAVTDERFQNLLTIGSKACNAVTRTGTETKTAEVKRDIFRQRSGDG